MSIGLQSIAADPLVTLGGFVLGLVGVILAIVFYSKSRKEKVPCFEEVSNTLIEGLQKTLDGLQLHYKGTAQERITVTKLAFWNAGRETIDSRDLVSTDAIGISCPEKTDVLDIQITQVSTASNAVSVADPVDREGRRFYPILFEYLDHEDFFVVQIVHNGEADKSFEIVGKIKGVKEIERERSTRRARRAFAVDTAVDILFENRAFMKYGASLTYFALSMFAIWALFQGWTSWYVWAGGALCFFFAVVMYFGSGRISPVKL